MKNFINFLPPWVETNIQPAFYDKESGTVLQQTARMYAKVNQLIRHFNDLSKETKKTIEEYIAKFVELKDYVDTYFENLDVQEEINNKLDEMTEDGTLAEIIGEYLFSKVKFIFPKFNSSETNDGDTSLIKINDKNILIDTHTESLYDYTVKDLLVNNNVTHVDYLIISHYDPDHIGGITNLINDGYIDNETTAYLPARVTTYGADYNNNQIITVNSLTTAGATIVYPLENQEVTIDDLKITFNNTNVAYLDALTDKDPNQCSMFCLFEHGETKTLFSGDAGTSAESHMRESDFPKSNIDLYKIPHHGLNGYCDYRYLKRLSPRYGVIIGCHRAYAKSGETVYGQEETILNSLGTIVYPTFVQNNYLEFESDGYSINCINGISSRIANRFISLTAYVDLNAPLTSIQDGTQDHPFSDINQALGLIPLIGEVKATINIADGDYTTGTGLTPIVYSSKNVQITFNGNSSDDSAVKLPNISIENAHVIFNHLTICNDSNNAVDASNSQITFNNVNVTSNSGEISTKNGIYMHDNTVVYASNLLVDKSKVLLVIRSGSTFNCKSNVTLGSYSDTYSVQIDADCRLNTNGQINFSDSSDKYAFRLYNQRRRTPVQILTAHENLATSLTLLVSAANFKRVDIFYHSSDNLYNSVSILDPNYKATVLFTPQVATGPAITNKQGKIRFDGTSVSVYGTTLVENSQVTSIDNPFNIDKIIGYYDYGFEELVS